MRWVAISSLLAAAPQLADACSTFAAGKKATADGSVIISHSDDGDTTGDARLVYVPAADHLPGSTRNVYFAEEGFPRMVTSDFGPDYEPTFGHKKSVPFGQIPQVVHTFGYQDSSYGTINENNVAIGESTCSAMFKTCAKGTNIGCEDGRTVGEAMMSVDTLSKIAMERAHTAREAIQIMGALAEEYGFYGTQDPNGSGEGLQVGDSNEAFTFHVLADPTGKSAIWGARRVPDEEVTMMANMFTIREMDPNDTVNCMFSKNIHDIAQARGWWKPSDGLLDFTKVYSNGEYAAKYYAGHRMWRGLTLVAPSQAASFPDYTNLRYDRAWPWSVKPDSLLTPHDFMRFHRDYLKGVPKLDMTKGPAAGAFGTPDRFATSSKTVQGSWPRTISIYRTDYLHIQQLRAVQPGLPKELAGVMWFGAGAGHYAPFVPIPTGVKRSLGPLFTGRPHMYNRTSMNWAVRKIGNICNIRFDKMHVLVEAAQSTVEKEGDAVLASAAFCGSNAECWNDKFEKHTEHVLEVWNDLADELLFRYSDNTDNLADAGGADGSLGYPDAWLKSVGFDTNAPPSVPVMDQCPPKCSPSQKEAPIVV